MRPRVQTDGTRTTKTEGAGMWVVDLGEDDVVIEGRSDGVLPGRDGVTGHGGRPAQSYLLHHERAPGRI